MTTRYFPARDNNNVQIRSFAIAVLLPDSWTKDKKWPWMMSVHGMGERSDGLEAHLKNLVEGIDFDKNGTVDWVFAMESMKKAVDQYGIVIVVPTYQGFFEPEKINTIYDFVVPEFSLVDKFVYEGFSLGGGAGLKYAFTNPNRLAYCVPVAPTRDFTVSATIAQAKLPVHIFVNDQDDNAHTNLSVTKAIVSDINKTNPPIPVIFTAFRQSGHGGHGEAVGINPPKAPSGQGFTEAAENIYQVYLDILKNGPRQMKAGVVVQPAPIPAPIPTGVVLKTRYELTGSLLKLIGRESTGYKDGLEGTWQFVSGPAGATKQLVFPTGSSYIDAQAKLPMPGTYVFTFTLKGESVNVTVEYAGEKTVRAFNIDTVAFSDGTTEKGTASFANGKWTIKTASKTYQL
jgi:dienelactone hydrolase